MIDRPTDEEMYTTRAKAGCVCECGHNIMETAMQVRDGYGGYDREWMEVPHSCIAELAKRLIALESDAGEEGGDE